MRLAEMQIDSMIGKFFKSLEQFCNFEEDKFHISATEIHVIQVNEIEM